MSWVQYWLPYLGVRRVPDIVAETVGLYGAPHIKYKAFVLSWLGWTLVFKLWEANEQDQN